MIVKEGHIYLWGDGLVKLYDVTLTSFSYIRIPEQHISGRYYQALSSSNQPLEYEKWLIDTETLTLLEKVIYGI